MKTTRYHTLTGLLLSCLLLLLLTVTASAADTVASGTCGAEGDGNNLTWTLDSDGVLTISGSGRMMDFYPSDDIPWVENKKSIKTACIESGVMSISDSAFRGCSSLTSVMIPNSVTSIDSFAFYDCTSLANITVPDSVTRIGNYAFSECKCLTSLTIGSSVTSIGDWAFQGSGLVSVTLPDSLTSIGSFVFNGCKSLTSVTLGSGVTSIGSSAFSSCGNLTSVTLGSGVTGIGDCVFSGCSSLISITLPNSVTSIGEDAFSGCGSLTDIVLPENVTSIRAGVFYVCGSLTSIAIPDSVTSIDKEAFYGCTGLKEVYYAGSESEWNAISVSSTGNDALKSARVFTKQPIYGEGYIITQVGADGSFCLNKDVPVGSKMIIAGYEEGGRMIGTSIYSFSATGSIGTAAAPAGGWKELRYFLIASDSTPLCERGSYPCGNSTDPDLIVVEPSEITGGCYRNVTIAACVGDGEVTLKNVTIAGSLTVKGGGSDSIKLIGCVVGGKVIMDKALTGAGGQQPRLELTNTLVEMVEVVRPAILESTDKLSGVSMVETKADLTVKGENTMVSIIRVPGDAEANIIISVDTGASVGEAIIWSENGASIIGGSGISSISAASEAAKEKTTTDGAEDIASHAHKWDSGKVTKAASCEETGTRVYTCTVEGCTPATKEEAIPATGHTFAAEWSKDDTCHWHAAVCGHDALQEDKAEHIWDSNNICSVCGAARQQAGGTYTVSYQLNNKGVVQLASNIPVTEGKYRLRFIAADGGFETGISSSDYSTYPIGNLFVGKPANVYTGMKWLEVKNDVTETIATLDKSLTIAYGGEPIKIKALSATKNEKRSDQWDFVIETEQELDPNGTYLFYYTGQNGKGSGGGSIKVSGGKLVGTRGASRFAEGVNIYILKVTGAIGSDGNATLTYTPLGTAYPWTAPSDVPDGETTVTDFVLTMQAGEDGRYYTAINGELGGVISGRIFTEQVSVKNSTDASLEIEDRACITFENCTFNGDVIVEFRERTDVSFDEDCQFLNGAKVIVNTPDGYQRPADGSSGLDFVKIDLECPDGKVESEQALISVFAAKSSFELNGMTATPDADNSYGRNEYSRVICIPLQSITLYEVQTSKNNRMTLTGAADRADIIRLCGNADISGLEIAADAAGEPTQMVEIRSYGVDDLQINIGSHSVEIQESGSYKITGSGKITVAAPNVMVNGTALPITCEISDLRFAKRDGYYLLKWDSTARRGISYRVYFNGSSNHETGTGDTFAWLGRIENTVGIRVKALYWDSSRNEVTVADMTNQDLRIQVTNDPEQSGTTAVFTQTTSGGYALEIHNIPAGIDYLFLRIRNGESGNGFYIPVNGAASYSGSVPSYNELLGLIDGGTYTIRGYSDFSLSADEKTLSYHEAELGRGLCIPDSMPQTTTISNVRFDEEDPGILRWDFIRGQDHALTDIRFRIVLTGDNGEQAESGTSDQSALLVPLDGVYTKVLVYAEDRATRTMLQSDGKAVSSGNTLTVRSRVGQTISQASAAFTKKDGSYQVDITGLTGYEAFFMRVDGDSYTDGTHGRVDSDGTAQRSLSTSLLEQTNARYSIYGAKDYRISASGELEFTIDCLCKEAPVTLPAA